MPYYLVSELNNIEIENWHWPLLPVTPVELPQAKPPDLPKQTPPLKRTYDKIKKKVSFWAVFTLFYQNDSIWILLSEKKKKKKA